MGAAVFDGRSAFLEVEDHPVLKGGTREFTVTGWVYTSAQDSDVVADVIGKFDPGTRTGLHIRSFDSPGPDDGLDGRPT